MEDIDFNKRISARPTLDLVIVKCYRFVMHKNYNMGGGCSNQWIDRSSGDEEPSKNDDKTKVEKTLEQLTPEEVFAWISSSTKNKFHHKMARLLLENHIEGDYLAHNFGFPEDFIKKIGTSSLGWLNRLIQRRSNRDS